MWPSPCVFKHGGCQHTLRLVWAVENTRHVSTQTKSATGDWSSGMSYLVWYRFLLIPAHLNEDLCMKGVKKDHSASPGSVISHFRSKYSYRCTIYSEQIIVNKTNNCLLSLIWTVFYESQAGILLSFSIFGLRPYRVSYKSRGRDSSKKTQSPCSHWSSL